MRIGTRGSALALAQAEWVAGRLAHSGHVTELVTITTLGDRGDAATDKSRWVSALEQALLAGQIDLAVHSAKDVPADLAPGTGLVAFPPREDPRDVICGAASLDELPAGARVGTSSLRRAAQVRAARDDLEVVELRGNVDTRLRKLTDGQADAIVLALAGLNRLGRNQQAGGVLEDLIPAAGQGALAVQARTGSRAAEIASTLSDDATARCVTAERHLVARLEATCRTPVGAHAVPSDAGVGLRAWVGLPDGSQWISDSLTGPSDTVGHQMAERLLAAGAAELLRQAEAQPA